MALTNLPVTAPPPRRPASARLLRIVLWTALALLAVVVGLVAWGYTDLTTPDDGDRYARELVERTAVGIADDVQPRSDESLDAELLAQRAVSDPRLADDYGDAEYDIRVLGWEGSTGDVDGARIELSIGVEVSGSDSGTFFSDSRTPGSSTSCWRFVVRQTLDDDVADHARIDCPDEPVAATPDPAPRPSLNPDAEPVVLAALDGLEDGTQAPEAQRVLQAAFPEFVDVRTERVGPELVASVGVAESRDCIIAVRPDGERAWRFSGFDRILIEPGEMGCDPALYLWPVTTH